MIHQYKLGGYNIVLDVCSGAVHAVDDVAYDMIAAFESADRADVISAIAEKYPNETAEDIAECYDQIAEGRGRAFCARYFRADGWCAEGQNGWRYKGTVPARCAYMQP